MHIPSEREVRRVIVCFGTRPEAIKMCPVALELAGRPEFDVQVCVTAQHREMLDQVLSLFGVKPTIDLGVMRPGQSLEGLTAEIVLGMSRVFDDRKPGLLVVQGDTTTTFAAALAAFYKKVPVAHVEAGLRTYDKHSPFPEEVNRQLTTRIADWHFAPTDRARGALLAEGIPGNRIFVVGNTVIDALVSVVEKARAKSEEIASCFPFLRGDFRVVLITGHRRESFGPGFERICRGIRALADGNPDVKFVYPMHLNPNVQEPVNRTLSNVRNVHLIEPQDYLAFVWLMDRSHIVLTDSGGIQEEAPALGKPVVVMRENTERPEAVEAGVATLVGTDVDKLVSTVQLLLDDEEEYGKMSRAQNPYGDGTSAKRIADVLEKKIPLERSI